MNLANDILNTILEFRRSHQQHTNCAPTCTKCQAPHLSKVIAAIKAEKPITLVLPAFPGKSPNLAKVLGTLPDMGEQIALFFLEELCERIRKVYAPGAHIILCSDGRVFSDIIGINETDVTDYQNEIDKMIIELGLKNISTFNLDEFGKEKDFFQMRYELMKEFGTSKELLREKILNEEEAKQMYLGITRFLVEDATFPGQTKTRTAIQKESKIKAYEVIRRSNAWSEFISKHFPEAVRLSIHPQSCGSKKLGIRLSKTTAESWMTPWHGVAVKTGDGFVYVKRTIAESLGAQLIYASNGRASHYEARI